MAGAASGLFVAAHTGSSISALTSQAFLLVMMVGGAVGFYLGIDTPPLAFDSGNGGKGSSAARIDAAELLTAIGTFCAALAIRIAEPVVLPRRPQTPKFCPSTVLRGQKRASEPLGPG